MHTISRDTALQICDAALQLAAQQGQARLAVLVTDAGGDIRAALRADGQAPFAFDIAHTKAQSALGFQKSTLLLSGFFSEAASSTIGITGVTGGRFIAIGGGIVVTNEAGDIVGAAAVSGGLPEADDAIARAAVDTVGLKALP